jgi:hypothetical protein
MLLTTLDAQEQEPHLQATSLEFFGKGGSEAWRCIAEDGRMYVVKAQNNGQDINQQRGNSEPLKVLTTELICGRLGQLFHPVVCPEVAIINIPENIAGAMTYPSNNRPVVAGPSFGSLWYSDMFDVKDKGRIELVPPDQVVKIIVYQTWLRGEDIAALVSADGRRVLSIDHGYYLSGSNWDKVKLDNPLPVDLVQFPQYQQHIDFALFQPVLEELRMFSESDILKAFTSIPAAWGGTIEFRAMLANIVLRRRTAVEQVISTRWKGVARW